MSLESDIKSIVESVGLMLYDTVITSENGETIYRVSVKDPQNKGVSLDRCVEITHLISPLLDVTPPVSGEYRLEVGTPGIERKLTKLENFVNSIGENVSLTTRAKEKLKGVLKGVKEDSLYLKIDNEEVVVPFGDVVKARTYFEW
ncbi:ribosome maturation factor [Sulfurimonas sp. HSL-1716]|uniref:ribosome maturation factor n=1 Tax=Hydrocurvibacter sulfurireducens TaxID=3131937 RepID=UPI0031F9DA9C